MKERIPIKQICELAGIALAVIILRYGIPSLMDRLENTPEEPTPATNDILMSHLQRIETNNIQVTPGTLFDTAINQYQHPSSPTIELDANPSRFRF